MGSYEASEPNAFGVTALGMSSANHVSWTHRLTQRDQGCLRLERILAKSQVTARLARSRQAMTWPVVAFISFVSWSAFVAFVSQE